MQMVAVNRCMNLGLLPRFGRIQLLDSKFKVVGFKFNFNCFFLNLFFFAQLVVELFETKIHFDLFL